LSSIDRLPSAIEQSAMRPFPLPFPSAMLVPSALLGPAAVATLLIVSGAPAGDAHARVEANRASDMPRDTLCAGACRLATPRRGNDATAHAPDGAQVVAAGLRRGEPSPVAERLLSPSKPLR
jgi:hypothetical protein